jgi:hypothetical protein
LIFFTLAFIIYLEPGTTGTNVNKEASAMVTLSIWTLIIGIAVILCLAVLDWFVSSPEMSAPLKQAAIRSAPLPQARKGPQAQSQRFPPGVTRHERFGSAA